MKIRKWMSLLLACVLIPALVASCGKKEGPSGSTTGTTAKPADPATSEVPGTEEKPITDTVVFAKDGQVQYRLVYPDNSGTMFQSLANEIATLAESLIGSRPAVQRESFTGQGQEKKPTVYIGYCHATEQAGLTGGLTYNAYRMTQKDGDLYLIASAGNALTAVGNQFKKSLLNNKNGKDIVFSFVEKQNEVTSQAEKIPTFRSDLSAYGFSTGAKSYQMLFPAAERSNLDAYLEQLREAGYTERERRTVPGLEYAAYGKDEDMLFITLSCGELRVSYEPLSACWLDTPSEVTGSYKTTGYLMGVWSGGDFENGMAMFYLLSDGTFLVFDGGHNESDADNLYRHLSAVAEEHGLPEVRISAWVITHFHGDHVGAFEPFLSGYSETVRIDRAVLGVTSSEQGNAATEADSLVNSALNALSRYQPDCQVVRLHTGQTLTLGDMTLEVLYTASDLAQGSLNDYNDASMVMRLSVGDKSILMTGDAATAAWTLLAKKYGTYLKSDYLQVPHHGAKGGGTIEAYDLIDPDALFWPAGDNLYQYVLTAENTTICRHLVDMVQPECVHIAGVDGKLTTFTFD